MDKIVVTGIYTENYRSMVELQENTCLDDFIFDYRFISDDEWNRRKTSEQFAFLGGNTIKTQLVIDKIKEYFGSVIIVADADLVFLKKVKKKIVKELADNDMVFLRERLNFKKNPFPQAPANVNIGFVVMRCNNNSLKYWEEVQTQVERTSGWDQEIANQILLDEKCCIQYSLLSENFLNGNDISKDNVFQQYICTSCGTVAKRNNLSKHEYLNKVIRIARGKENIWFDGSKLKKRNGLNLLKHFIKRG